MSRWMHWSWAVAALASVAVGCGDTAPRTVVRPTTVASTPPPAATSPPPIATGDEELERLRALGYLDYSEEPTSPPAPGEGVVKLDRRRAQPGYTLVVYAGACTADLITLDGTVVHTWSDSPCRRWEEARLLDDGTLLVVGSRSDKDDPVNQQMEGRYLLKLSWEGEEVWRRQLTAHHDLQILPDGHLLTLLMERRTVPAVDPEVEIWDDLIALLDDRGEVLETVSVYDVLASGGFPLVMAGRGERDGERWIDLLHCNAAHRIGPTALAGTHPVYRPGNVIVTSRHQDSVFVIDWESRRLLWHWGRGELSGPHAASMQDDGRILIFDNGLQRRWSRVIEVDPITATIVRAYTTPDKSRFFSRVMGSSSRLANGNVLIANSAGGQGLELTREGQPVWMFLATRRTAEGHRLKIPRLHRLPTEMVERLLDRRRPEPANGP